MLSNLYQQQSNALLHQIVVDDESWCYHFEPESKRQSIQRKRMQSQKMNFDVNFQQGEKHLNVFIRVSMEN